MARTPINAEKIDYKLQGLARAAVYKEMPSVIVQRNSLSLKLQDVADGIFRDKIMKAEGFKRNKLKDKREFFRCLFQAALRATHCDGCIRYSHKPGRHGCTKANLQVLQIAVATDLLREVKSPPGRPQMSRYIPLSPLRQHATSDPWDFDDCERTAKLVILRRRNDKEEISFNPANVVAKDVERRLQLVNQVNSQFTITFVPQETVSGQRTRQLRPIHFAIFTGDFNHHGRLYTRGYGHQSLRKSERATIRFGKKPSVELDFSGLHSRMLYHLEKIDYRGDPYALWGKDTTQSQRLMAKKLINVAINATSKTAAVSRCNNDMNPYKDSEKRIKKSGKELEHALELKRTVSESGLTFSQVYALVEARHCRITKYFGSDMGLTLMRLDSAIALDVLHHFARQGIPCLSRRARAMPRRSPLTRVTPALSMATSVPVPIAMPICA
jgi:hypothetical protein